MIVDSIGDGADVTQGATTDAAVVSDANGTVSGKLRGLVKMLADVWVSGSHWLKVSIQNATLAVTQSGTWSVEAQDGSGNPLTSTGSALDVNLKTSALGGALEAGGNLAAVAAVEGTTADTAVVTDANGTVSAKLRGLVKLLASVISSGLLQIRALTSSDQITVANSSLAVTQSGNWSVRGQDGSGNALTSTSSALDVNLKTLAYGALPVIKIGTTVTLAIGASSAASAAITATVVRLVATSDYFIVFGAATPTATTAGLFLPANAPEYFQFTSGQEVAVIQSSASGNLYVTAAA